MPSGIDKMINQTIDPIQLLLANPLLNRDRRASFISSCSKTLTKYKFDLLSLNLDIIQNIRRGCEQLLHDLQMNMSQTDWNQSLKQIIEKRQQTMRKRHETFMKHQLDSFFDEAPTVVNP